MATHDSTSDQDREYFLQAERNTDRTGPQRRDALMRLLQLAHSPHTEQKKLATEKIKDYFPDFPDLQDEAINTIYDLCEDPSPKIRMAGYEAITSVSRVDKNWLVRNADVLVQLLQSDEKDEVEVVKRALLDHVELDPTRTLQVLCDQCTFDSDVLDQEERALRGRLRTLVVHFLAEKATTAIVRVVKNAQNGAEQVLFHGLLSAIPKSTYGEVDTILTKIFPLLPSLRTRGANGETLLATLLDSTSTMLKDELRAGSELSGLANTQMHLRLAHIVAVDQGAAEPLQLLRFYVASGLVSKITLLKLTEETRLAVLSGVADALDACEHSLRRSITPNREQVVGVRNQLVDASPILIELLTKNGLTEERLCRACHSLLKSCESRKLDSKWTVPSHLAACLRATQDMAAKQLNGPKAGVAQSIQNLCRSLLTPVPPRPPAPAPAPTTASPRPAPADTNHVKGSVASSSSGSASHAPGSRGKRRFGEEHAERRGVGAAARGAHANDVFVARDGGPARRGADADERERSRKRTRAGVDGGGGGGGGGAPSLLSRLAVDPGGGGGRGANVRFELPARPATAVGLQPAVAAPSAGGGLQIRGAALKKQPSSLLDRINHDDEGGAPNGGQRRW